MPRIGISKLWKLITVSPPINCCLFSARSPTGDLQCDISHCTGIHCEENPYVITPPTLPLRPAPWGEKTAFLGQRWACSQLDVIVEAPNEELQAMTRQISSSLSNLYPHTNCMLGISQDKTRGIAKSRSMQTLYRYNKQDIPETKRSNALTRCSKTSKLEKDNDGTWV